MKTIEIVMYAIAISLNIITLICGYLIIYRGTQIGVYTVIFQIALTIGAVIFTFTALLLTIVRKNKKKYRNNNKPRTDLKIVDNRHWKKLL